MGPAVADALHAVWSFSPVAVWFWALALIALVWLRRHRDLNRAGDQPILAERDAASGDALPPLTVLVAAKDEAANIATCVGGLLRQDYPRLQVIAIDDRSADRTGAILDEISAGDPRLHVIHVGDLPAGWFGKCHAMHLGVQATKSEWMCFTDADCRFHSPALLRAAMSFADRNRVEFLSVLPVLEAHTFWEQVVQPPAGAIMVFWYSPEKVNDPDSSRAYANGAFMLMNRSVYDALGGHAAVPQTLNEDMHLARRCKREGRRLFVMRGGGLYSVRMYVGFKQIWRGWSRIFYGCFGSLTRLLLSAAVLLIFSVSPYLTLLASPWAGPAAPLLALAAATAIAVQQTVLWRYYALSQVRPSWALTYPLGAALCVGMLLNATTRAMGRRTVWRGTTYQRGA